MRADQLVDRVSGGYLFFEWMHGGHRQIRLIVENASSYRYSFTRFERSIKNYCVNERLMPNWIPETVDSRQLQHIVSPLGSANRPI
jgi:hypothetical protein